MAIDEEFQGWTELELACLHVRRTSMSGMGSCTDEMQPLLLHEELVRYTEGFEPRGYFKGYLELTEKGQEALRAAWARPRAQVATDEEDEAGSELDREWRREIAMEAGMLHGVDAYNDAMGY